MAYYSGTSGQMLLDGTRLGRVTNWSFSTSLGLLDTTCLSDTDKSSVPGVRSTTGACRLFYHSYIEGGTPKNDCGTLLRKLVKQGWAGEPNRANEAVPVTLRLKIDDSSVEGKYIEGKAYLTSVSMAMAVGEVLSADIAFELTGAPTIVAL